ncbi:MAG: hypothetical protein EAY75_06930 [Bacteroidetes bacterium]|nr:MAG: hypothetical protein EAY75_06930 [Bacteroidota bacterium]
MKLWISGRIEGDIQGPVFSQVLREVRDAVNSCIQTRDYGPGIESWDVIIVIYKENIKPSIRYKQSTRETDIEIPLSHHDFINGDNKVRKRLFFDALTFSLEKLRDSKKVKEFAFDKVIEDMASIAQKELN